MFSTISEGRELGEVGVVVGVVHDLHARVGQLLHGLGVFIHPLADKEEGGRDAVRGEDVDELLRILVAPGGVETEGDELAVAFHAVDGSERRVAETPTTAGLLTSAKTSTTGPAPARPRRPPSCAGR